MISKIHIARFDVEESQFFQSEEFMTEKDIKVLMEEIIRETNISELCNKQGIDANTYYNWGKNFIRITRSKLKNTNNKGGISSEIVQLRNENLILNKLVVELNNEIRLLKKRLESSSRVN